MSTERVYKHIANGLAAQKVAEGDSTEVIRLVNRSNAVFCEAFHKESGQILKWSLLIFLSKRCPTLCVRLVDCGLTETLLMSVLDVSRPVQQAAALSELHRLRLVSPLAQKIAVNVLSKPELIQATSLVEFMNVAKPSDLERARYRLRNVWSSLHCIKNCHEARYSADELSLRQKLLEQDMADSIGITESTAFLTDVPTAETTTQDDGKVPSAGADNNAKSSNDDMIVHRAGKDKFDVRRVPVLKKIGGGADDEHSRCVMGPVEEIPFCGSLSSLIFDPLDISADEESPLIQELRTIEGFGTFRLGSGGVSLRRNVESSGLASRRHRMSGSRPHRVSPTSVHKDSHHPSLAHTRALVLRPMPPKGVEHHQPKKPVEIERAPSAMTECTELSLRCGSIRDLGEAGDLAETVDEKLRGIQRGGVAGRGGLATGLVCQPCGQAEPDDLDKGLHDTSLAETSAGPDWLQDHSQDLTSGGPSTELLTAGPSMMTDSSDPFDLHDGCMHCSLDRLRGISEGPSAYVSQRTPMVAVLEVPKSEEHAETDQTPPVRKRILQVAPTVPHVCLAFDPFANERERQRVAEEVTTLLHPKTRRLFEDINGAGKFPKKKVVRLEKIAQRPMTHTFSYPSGSMSAREDAPGGALWGFSEEADEELIKSRSSWFQEHVASAVASDEATAPRWQPVEKSHRLLQDAGERMRSLFPASARSVA